MKRYLTEFIRKDLEKKIVIVGGPRQVGKTTLALSLLREGSPEHPAYLNWDFPEARVRISRGQIPLEEPLIILDEIHKYRQWRNLVKGLFDKYKTKKSFLVTGSARLDHYRKGGDSLLGRYYFYRLHPLSLYEISPEPTAADLSRLLEFGGFPEMYLSQDRRELKLWQRQRVNRVIQDDLLSLEQVKDVANLELLAALLPERVGSLLSIQSLREDLVASHEAVSRWLLILENVYYCYRIPPMQSTKIKALKKDKKLYLWDWSTVSNVGARFENLVASHLLKYCHYIEDVEGDVMSLCYLRDQEKREIDFVVLKNEKPVFAVECKSSDTAISKTIRYFAQRVDIPIFYQVHQGTDSYEDSDSRCQVMPFVEFCARILKV